MCFADSRKLSKFIGKSPKRRLDYFDLYNLKLNGISVNVYVSRKRATKATHIHCTESGDIMWEQFYLFGGMSRPARDKRYVLRPVQDKNVATVVVIKGTPGNITGLEEKINSHRSSLSTNRIFLLSARYALPFFKMNSQ